MLYDILKELDSKRAVLKLGGNGLTVCPDGSVNGLENYQKDLEELMERLGANRVSSVALLDEYLSGYTFIDNQGALNRVVKTLSESPAVAIDLETTGLDPRLDHIRLIGLSNGKHTYVIETDESNEMAVIESLEPLFSGNTLLIFQNAAFDLEFLYLRGLEAPSGAIYDTGVAEQLILGSSRMPSLRLLTRRYLGIIMDKSIRNSDWSGPLTEEQRRYNALDAMTTWLIYDKQTAGLFNLGLERVADIEFRFIPALVWMRAHGVPLDLECWYSVVEEELSKAQDSLGKLDPNINWNSPTQVLKFLQDSGLNINDTSYKSLVKYADNPIVKTLLEYREHQKRISTYGSQWEKFIHPKTGRLHPSWKAVGAETGRMACSNPNVMQIPRDATFRRCFKASPGRAIIKADFSQIELRLAALISGDVSMLRAFKNGEDLHTRTAMTITGKPQDQITKTDRQLAKALNFGLIYGMGAERFQEHAYTEFGIRLSLEEAQQFRERFFRAYPELRAWHRSQEDGLVEVRTLTGRRRMTDRYTEKLNTVVQGTGADIIKLALALLYERRKDLPDVYPILAVHDEIVIDSPESKAEEAKNHLVRAMLDAAHEITSGGVTIEVEAGVYRDWSAKEPLK